MEKLASLKRVEVSFKVSTLSFGRERLTLPIQSQPSVAGNVFNPNVSAAALSSKLVNFKVIPQLLGCAWLAAKKNLGWF